LLLHSLG